MQQLFDIQKIKKINNIMSLFAASTSVIGIIAHQYFENNILIQPSAYLVLTYCFMDILFCRKDLRIHHLLTISTILFSFMYGMRIEDSINIYSTLISTELSTIFYIFDFWLVDYNGANIYIVKGINALIFATAFTKLRIHDFYYMLVNPETHTTLARYTNNRLIPTLQIYISIIGLFALNVFWFSLICKKIYKTVVIRFVPKLNTDYVAEKLSTYTFFANMYAAATSYGSNPAFFYDIFGISTLSICSYIFHGALAQNFKTQNVINYTSPKLITPYILDTFAIHMRSFLVVVTNFMLSDPSKRYFIFLSAQIHIVAIVCFFITLIHFVVTGKQFIYDSDSKEPNKYKTLFYLLLMVPSGIDCGLIFWNNPSISAKMDLLIINIVVAVVVAVQPFYKLNHLLIHLGLYIQTCVLIRCNLIMDSQNQASHSQYV
jgi:hypothetical protein